MVVVVVVVAAVLVYDIGGTEKKINGTRCQGWAGRVNQTGVLVSRAVKKEVARCHCFGSDDMKQIWAVDRPRKIKDPINIYFRRHRQCCIQAHKVYLLTCACARQLPGGCTAQPHLV